MQLVALKTAHLTHKPFVWQKKEGTPASQDGSSNSRHRHRWCLVSGSGSLYAILLIIANLLILPPAHDLIAKKMECQDGSVVIKSGS